MKIVATILTVIVIETDKKVTILAQNTLVADATRALIEAQKDMLTNQIHIEVVLGNDHRGILNRMVEGMEDGLIVTAQVTSIGIAVGETIRIDVKQVFTKH